MKPVEDKLSEDVELGSDARRQHFWEHGIFGDRRVHRDLRQGFKYEGVYRRKGGLPLLLAAVEGTDHEGRLFRWVARRARKRVLQPYRCSKPLPPVDWLGWLDARQHWRKLGWWIAILYSLGSLLFVISGVAGEIQSVVESSDGVRSLSAALIAWPNLIAANLCFFPAGAIQIVESTNMDFGSKLAAWQEQGGKGPRPHHRLQPHRDDLRTISWWASVIQWTGMMGFNIATIAAFLATIIELQAGCWLADLAAAAPDTARWTINFGFTYGGAAFTVSAVMFAMEATGSWWRGLVPSRTEDLRSISWHAAFWNFYGSAGFLIGGAATYATSFSWTQLQIINGVGNLGGAVWFLMAALAAALEQANPGRT
ncbi:hypothetical protein CHLNCDRAFT_141603 [Chlorella variabilis]|uniref:Uncharacterized protein n=1 Tax=Chlorella variabilis TaxID=554065 RepID=E1ZTA8_CHLVA|nr:hypothetical protein CHLNCDRAFT_141603 [Chlorella variabilis]EFN50967.1 hypothetical protein CHLNCDRAFT_141603 [Chlorella variabilis]|eukprot:XP_005843069.1 hypothetical protein CHLNCDRAFT_141603 [Chlorella variabilis]